MKGNHQDDPVFVGIVFFGEENVIAVRYYVTWLYALFNGPAREWAEGAFVEDVLHHHESSYAFISRVDRLEFESP